MTTSSSSAAAAAAAAAATPSAPPSSTLSPHAAPFAPPDRRHDGDVSRLVNAGFAVVHGEDENSGDIQPASSSTACFGKESCDADFTASTNGADTSQRRTWTELYTFYPEYHTSSVVVSYPSDIMASIHKQKSPLTSGKGSGGSKCPALKIERPPNRTSETAETSCAVMNKSDITKNVTKSNEDAVKNASFPKSFEGSSLVNGNGKVQDTMICSNVASSVSHLKPLHIPATCADPRDYVADDVKPDPSECSVDSPCWRGASVSHLPPFDVFQTSAPHSTNPASVQCHAGLKQSPSNVQPYEALAEPKDLEAIKNKQNHSQFFVESSVSITSGDIGTNQAKDSQRKGLESANKCAAKCTAEQKHSSEMRDNCVKLSGLNSAAPDFVPSSVGKPKIGKGRIISGILKEIQNLSEELWSSYSSDEIELEERDHSLLQSVIENLQNCLHKTRKGPIKDGAFNKAGLKAPHSQTTALKSDAGNYNGSYTADCGKSIVVNNLAGPSHILHDFGKNSLTRSQPSFNNFPKKIPCEEEHSQILVYKDLWIDAERSNCELKYLLKCTYMKMSPESSSMAHIGGPINRPSQNLQGNHVLSASEETGTHNLAHPWLQLAPSRSQREFKKSAMNEMSTCSYIPATGTGVFLSNSEYDSLDWDHVQKEEIGWS